MAICPSCDSKFAYVRIKTKQIVCRDCGEITDIKKDKQNKRGERK